MAHSVSYLKEAIRNYEEMDPRTEEQEDRLNELKAELVQVREKNQRKNRNTPEEREAIRQRKIERVDAKIAKKERGIDYFRTIRHTNPAYFDKMIANMEFDLKVLRSTKRSL